MIIERRDLLKWGLAAPALASGMAGFSAGASASAMAKEPLGLDALVLDTRLGAKMPDHGGIPLHRFHGDVTALWVDVLDPQWRKPGFVVGGITGQDALFLIERFAWDRGRRVVARTQIAPTQINRAGTNAATPDGRPAISWIIAPHHPSMKA